MPEELIVLLGNKTVPNVVLIHFGQVCRKNPQCQQCPKNVQEVQANSADQNTGKIQNDIDIVNMIRSLGLHEQCETKKDNQLHQPLSVQELSIHYGRPTQHGECNINPVFQAPVTPTDTGIVWDSYQNIMELDIHIATPIVSESHELNLIMIHDVELKCSYFSYITIAGQPVKVKQDTGAEVNVMPKHIFDKLSNGNKSKALLNKAKMMTITGYGQNPISYIGTYVFKVKHNDVQRDVLFFITNVDDT